MRLSDLLAPLLDAKVDHELIRQQIIAYEKSQSDALEQRRKADAERQARKRSRDVTLRHSDRVLAGAGDARVEDKTLTTEIEPQEEKKETRERAFDAFWGLYPHKVGKADAKAKFAVAARKVDHETLMAALRRYVAKTDDRPWCNPSTWLHQERWTDQPATAPPRASPARPVNPTLVAARVLQDQLDAVTPSEIEGHHPPPRLVAIGNR